jgi:DDE family transposase
MDASAAAPVLRLASRVADPRRHNRVHPLPEMIVMALVAILCGSDGWDDVADFCDARDDWFRTFLTLPRGVPSHDTFGRVFARVDPLQLEAMLQQWMAALHVASGGKLIAIDGKSLRRSFQHAWDTSGMAHVVSAFAGENQMVLANLGVLDKENEIVAIPKLLAMLDLTGSTVTIDAIGCQRDIAQQIVVGGGVGGGGGGGVGGGVGGVGGVGGGVGGLSCFAHIINTRLSISPRLRSFYASQWPVITFGDPLQRQPGTRTGSLYQLLAPIRFRWARQLAAYPQHPIPALAQFPY